MTLSLGYLPPVYVSQRNYSDDFDGRDSGWKGSGFAVAGGAATITPTEGSERSFNGDLESWASPTNANSFSEVVGGSSSVNQEATTKHGGSYAARLDVDSSNTLVNLTQTINGTTGEWTLARFWLRASTAGKTGSLASSAAGYSEAPARNPGTDWTQYLQNGRFTADGGQYQWGRVSAASASLYLDDLSIKPLTLATMFAVRRSTTSDVQVAAGWTVEPGTWSGVAACLDDPNNPQNFILGITNGAYAKLVKCVAGVYTELVNEAVVYIDDAGVEIHKVGGGVRLIYNGEQIGTDQTIGDAGIMDNVHHGLFSGYSGNSAASFAYQGVAMTLSLAQLLPVYPSEFVHLLRLEFPTDYGVGDVPTPYSEGFGSITLTETDGEFSTSGGSLVFPIPGTPSYVNQNWQGQDFVRVTGRAVIGQLTLNNNGLRHYFGWLAGSQLDATNAAFSGHIFLHWTGGSLFARDVNAGPVVDTYASATDYQEAVVMRSVGADYLRKAGGVWEHVWRSLSGNEAIMRPAMINQANSGTMSLVRVINNLNGVFATDTGIETFRDATLASGDTFTATADGIHDFEFTLPASPSAGDEISLEFRRQDASNYHRMIVKRNVGNTAWDVQVRTVTAGTPATPVGWTDVTGVGTPDGIRVKAKGAALRFYTKVAALFTQRGAALTNSNFQTEVDLGITAAAGATLGVVYSIPTTTTAMSDALNVA